MDNEWYQRLIFKPQKLQQIYKRAEIPIERKRVNFEASVNFQKLSKVVAVIIDVKIWLSTIALDTGFNVIHFLT